MLTANEHAVEPVEPDGEPGKHKHKQKDKEKKKHKHKHKKEKHKGEPEANGTVGPVRSIAYAALYACGADSAVPPRGCSPRHDEHQVPSCASMCFMIGAGRRARFRPSPLRARRSCSCGGRHSRCTACGRRRAPFRGTSHGSVSCSRRRPLSGG